MVDFDFSKSTSLSAFFWSSRPIFFYVFMSPQMFLHSFGPSNFLAFFWILQEPSCTLLSFEIFLRAFQHSCIILGLQTILHFSELAKPLKFLRAFQTSCIFLSLLPSEHCINLNTQIFIFSKLFNFMEAAKNIANSPERYLIGRNFVGRKWRIFWKVTKISPDE